MRKGFKKKNESKESSGGQNKDESETGTWWVGATFYLDKNEISEYFVTRFGVGKRL